MKNRWMIKMVCIISFCFLIPMQIKAESKEVIQGSYMYQLNAETKEAVISKYTGQEAVVTIPAEVIDDDEVYKVTEIGEWSFEGNTTITHVTIPEGVKRIGEMAFASDSSREQTNLKSVQFPSTLESIGQYAFLMTSLEKVDLPSGLKEISVGAFQETNLTEIIIPKGVTELNAWIVSSCKKLQKIVIHAAVNKIDPDFYGSVVKEIIIHPDNPAYKVVDESIVSKDGKTLIAVFTGKKSYKTPKGIVKIGEDAIAIPTLEELTISEGVEVLESYAIYLRGLRVLHLPKTLKEIGEHAISAEYMTSLYLPDGVQRIGRGAFEFCQDLNFITIPSTVKEIGSFLTCDSTEIQFLSNKPPKIIVEENEDKKINTSKVYVPKGKAAAYKKSLKGVVDAKKIVEVKKKKIMTDSNLESVTITGVLGENMYGGKFKRKGRKYEKNAQFYHVQPGKEYIFYAKKGRKTWKVKAETESLIKKVGKTNVVLHNNLRQTRINNGDWENKTKYSGLKSGKKYVIYAKVTSRTARLFGYKKGKVFKQTFYTKK